MRGGRRRTKKKRMEEKEMIMKAKKKISRHGWLAVLWYGVKSGLRRGARDFHFYQSNKRKFR